MLTKAFSLVALLALASAQFHFQEDRPFNYSGYEILNVDIANKEQADTLKMLSEDLQLDLWNDPNPFVGYALVQVPPELKEVVHELLEKEGLTPITVIPDFQKAIEKERAENEAPAHGYKRDISSFDYARYRQITEINSFMNQVQQEYPNLAQVFSMGTSYENRQINGIRITNATPGTKPVIFIECGIHAREWVTQASALYFIGQLTSNKSPAIQTLINNFEWHIVPSTNPDGYVYTHTRNRNWRKTRSQSRVMPTCYGADPNRNFDTSFCTVGASRTPCADTYCGDSAFSEKETQALRNYVTRLGSRIKVYFGIHSFSQLWMYPYGYTRNLPSNYQQLSNIATKSVAALAKPFGTYFKHGPIATAIYEASGSSVDWVYDKIGVRVAFALELRDTGRFGFMLPVNQIIPTASETFEGIKTAVLMA